MSRLPLGQDLGTQKRDRPAFSRAKQLEKGERVG
jgi:hypothetical protein